jgi:hypothetical protein
MQTQLLNLLREAIYLKATQFKLRQNSVDYIYHISWQVTVYVHSDQNLSMHLMVTIHKFTVMFKFFPTSLLRLIDTLKSFLKNSVQCCTDTNAICYA